ncbi:MAG: cytochrome b/b6 domain-containing protein [Coriobacteriia bacterium]|nr:cytochrome b/b6 domain-containing protein [Coriobacteriia bacterium]
MIEPEPKIGIKIFSGFKRFFHWSMVIFVILLFLSGLYIGDPGFNGLVGTEPTYAVKSFFTMSAMRKMHLICGLLLIVVLLMNIYSSIRYPGDRLMPKFASKKYWKDAGWAVKHYLFFPVKEHEYLRSPLARLSYFLIYICFFIMAITGLAMMVQIDPTSIWGKIFGPVNNLFSEYTVHYIHHVVAWVFIIFAIIHMYLAVRTDYLEHNGELSAMFSGYKFYAYVPFDAEDVPGVTEQFLEKKRDVLK